MTGQCEEYTMAQVCKGIFFLIILSLALHLSGLISFVYIAQMQEFPSQ